MKASSLRSKLACLKRWPLHPQWVVFRRQRAHQTAVTAWAQGLVLDIGAGRQEIREFLPPDCCYISLDYWETAVGWYHTRPHIFGDGQRLPIMSAGVDTALLLDVLEHLPCPEACLAEIERVLKPGGRLVLQVPFLYPLHDEPYDFRRWTIHGLRRLAKQNNFDIVSEDAFGRPPETAALLVNLALAHDALAWLETKSLKLILLPLVPPLILFVNLCGWVGSRLSLADGWMPHGYRMVWQKRI